MCVVESEYARIVVKLVKLVGSTKIKKKYSVGLTMRQFLF